MNICKLIDDYLLSEEQREIKSHHPSSITRCQRQLYYGWTKEPISDPIDAGAILKMKIGNSIHDIINEILVGTGHKVENEISFKYLLPGSEYPISGRLDNIITIDDKKVGIEVKTSFGKGILKIANNKAPDEEHLWQVMTYLYCTDINDFILLYVARDIAFKTAFDVTYKDEAFYVNNDLYMTEADFEEHIIMKLSALEENVKFKKVPERDYAVAIKNGEIKDMFQRNSMKYKSDWQCLYCKWTKSCWAEECVKYISTDNYADVVQKLRND